MFPVGYNNLFGLKYLFFNILVTYYVYEYFVFAEIKSCTKYLILRTK